MNNKKLKILTTRISKLSTFQLVLFPGLLSLIPIGIIALVAQGRAARTPLEIFLGSSMLFLWGAMGVPMVIRKESPGMITIRGPLAVIEGVLIMLGAWSVMVDWLIRLYVGLAP